MNTIVKINVFFQKSLKILQLIFTSDATELEIGELSRAELSWIFPSRAELADFQKRAEPSWMFF